LRLFLFGDLGEGFKMNMSFLSFLIRRGWFFNKAVWSSYLLLVRLRFIFLIFYYRLQRRILNFMKDVTGTFYDRLKIQI
jgi:hypothetical protein